MFFFLWQLLMMTLSHQLSILPFHPTTFVPLPCVSPAEETMYHSTLFWYRDEWGESVPVDCGLEIKNKQMKLPACLAGPWSPLPPFLMLIWLRTLDQHILLDPHTFAPGEVLRGGQRIEDAIMARSNNNLSPGCLSQRIMFKLGPLSVVYIKVKCGSVGEGRTELETVRKGGQEHVDKKVRWGKKWRWQDVRGIQRRNTSGGRKMDGREDKGWERSTREEKIGEYLTILVCVPTPQLMWSQKDSLLLSAVKQNQDWWERL